jgi:hypothetical protein
MADPPTVSELPSSSLFAGDSPPHDVTPPSAPASPAPPAAAHPFFEYRDERAHLNVKPFSLLSSTPLS